MADRGESSSEAAQTRAYDRAPCDCAAHLRLCLRQHTNFDLNTRAPLMFHVPGRTDGGIETEQITSTVDIFPTVVDLVFGRTLPTCGKTASGSSHG